MFYDTLRESKLGSLLPPEEHSSKATNKELLDDLRRVAKIVDGAPTAQEYHKLGEYSCGTYARRFGSWSKAHEKIGRETKIGGLLPPEEHAAKATNKQLLDNLRDIADNERFAPSHSKIGESEYSCTAYRNRFGGIWAATVRAGLLPELRPLSIDSYRKYHKAALELRPRDAVVALLPQFTGMAPPVIANFSKDWQKDRSDKRIIKLPKKHTDTELSWMFRIPEVWIHPDEEVEIDTNLPELLDWYWQFNDTLHVGKEAIRERVKRTARESEINSREKVEHTSVGRCPNVSPQDLSFTHGVNLARRGIEGEDIVRRLGTDYRGNGFSLRNIFVWCDEKYSDFSHPDWH